MGLQAHPKRSVLGCLRKKGCTEEFLPLQFERRVGLGILISISLISGAIANSAWANSSPFLDRQRQSPALHTPILDGFLFSTKASTSTQLLAQTYSNDLTSLIRNYNPDLATSEIDTIARWTEHYSREYGIDPRLIAGLVARESGFNPKATSRSGARGLGQISASLAKDLGIRDRYDIRQNLEGTTRWIRTLYDTWLADGVEESQATHWTLASYRQGLTRTRQIGIPSHVAEYINEVYEIAADLPKP